MSLKINFKIFQGLNKQSLLYLGICLIAALIVILLTWHLSQVPEIKEEIFLYPPLKSGKEIFIEKQLKELEKLKTEIPLLTEKEIKKQLKELEKPQKVKSLSQEEIEKQLKELISQ